MSKPFITAVVLAFAGLLAAVPGLAQQASVLEEVVVTAKFRDTKLIDTVGSVSVIPESAIEERAAKHLQDVLNTAPNVSWASGASRSRFVQIRGVGDLELFYDQAFLFYGVSHEEAGIAHRRMSMELGPVD